MTLGLHGMMLLMFLLFADTLAGGQGRKANFVIFQPDEMRAESLGCYGHPASKTPNMDKFAAGATRFDQAHVAYTVCSQSRTAFVTGWPAHVNGHRSLWALLHDWEPNLFKSLKSEGYTVKWWGKNDMLAVDAWNQSVTSAMSMPGAGNGVNSFEFGHAGYYSFLSEATPEPAEKTKDYANTMAAIEFLRSKPAEPFMIFLPLTKPHPPYSVPEPYYSSIDPDTLPPLRPVGNDVKPDYHALIRKYRNLTSLDDAFFRKLHAVYLGSISYSDFLFGMLLAALDETGYADSTTVAVFADHGDYAGDYGLVEKWPSGLEDVLTRVPLLVRTPGGAQGHVVKEVVQLYDIVPTILEIANASQNFVQFGRSLTKQLSGSAGDAQRTVFAEGGYGTFEPRDNEGSDVHFQPATSSERDIYYPKSLQQREHPLSVMRSVMARTMTHKLVLRSDQTAEEDRGSELYDLVKDPEEMHNVFGHSDYAEVQADLKSRILRWYMETSDVAPWKLDDRGGGMPWPKPGHGELQKPGPMVGGVRGPDDFVEFSPPERQTTPVVYFSSLAAPETFVQFA